MNHGYNTHRMGPSCTFHVTPFTTATSCGCTSRIPSSWDIELAKYCFTRKGLKIKVCNGTQGSEGNACYAGKWVLECVGNVVESSNVLKISLPTQTAMNSVNTLHTLAMRSVLSQKQSSLKCHANRLSIFAHSYIPVC